MYPNSLFFFDNRIYIPSTGNFCIHVLQYNHDHILARHYGQNKTLKLVCHGYSWPSLCTDVQQFYKFCVTCMYNNSTSSVSLVCNISYNVTSPMNLLNNFLSPNNHGIPFLWTLLRNSCHPLGLTLSWSQLTSLPSRQSLSLLMILLYLQTQHVCLFFVFSKYGIPSHVTSNRSSEFVLNFFCSLGTALNIQLYFTSGSYPKDDRQTKYMNQTLEQYLCIYYNYQQDNWSKLLPLVKFAYNNALSAPTSVFPFFSNKEYHPNITIHSECNIAFS